MRGSCASEEQATAPAAVADLAAATADGSALDSAREATEDAAVDAQTASPAAFPDFQNPSMEITSGAANGGLISSFAVQVSPWLGCGPPGFGPGAYPQGDLRVDASSGTPTEAEMLAPSDGSSLLIITPDGTSVAQTLTAPLSAGTRYAFLVDIAGSEGATDLTLLVQGSSGCLSPETLTTTLPARAGAWTSVCVAFTPDKPYSSLMLTAVAATAAASPRLFVDNLRADPSCQ